MLDERLRHHVVLWCHAKEAAMTQAEVEAAISLLAEQIAKLQEKQGKHTQDWRRLATLSGWLSVTCVWLGAIFAVAMLVIGFLHDGGDFDLTIHACKRAAGHPQSSPLADNR
jgi:hypothetical protein